MPRIEKLLAIMWTDIVGYTKIMGENEKTGFILLDESKKLNLDLIERHNGKYVKDVADAVLSTFPSPTQAVLCAIKIREKSADIPGLKYHIGIHLGEVTETDNDVLGDSVNIASRLCDEAKEDQIYISEAVQRNVSNKIDHKIVYVKKKFFENVKDSIAIYNLPKPDLSPKIVEVNPYKGLQYFNVEDSTFFFGREREIDLVFKNLSVVNKEILQGFIAIVGDSGSGKSSFARAGILNGLRIGKFRGTETWKQIKTNPGPKPLFNLFKEFEGVKPNTVEVFVDAALSNDDTLIKIIGSEKHILLIDQFEELITQCDSEKERSGYLSNIIKAVSSGLLIIIITLRQDFYFSFARYDAFFNLLNNHYLFLLQLDFFENKTDWEKKISAIIENPAKKFDVRFESGLVKTILEGLKEVKGGGVLSILQVALASLWEKKENNLISHQIYTKETDGKGIGRIIEKKADEVYKEYTEQENNTQKIRLFKNTFLQLVEITQSKEDVRRTLPKTLLVEILEKNNFNHKEIENAISFLVGNKARLLTIKNDENDRVTIEIVHEVLIRKWEKLKKWVEDKRGAYVYKEGLEHSIDQFLNSQDYKDLYDGTRLQELNDWVKQNPEFLDERIKDFQTKSNRKKDYIFKKAVEIDYDNYIKIKSKRILYLGKKLENLNEWVTANTDLVSDKIKYIQTHSTKYSDKRDMRGIILVEILIVLMFLLQPIYKTIREHSNGNTSNGNTKMAQISKAIDTLNKYRMLEIVEISDTSEIKNLAYLEKADTVIISIDNISDLKTFTNKSTNYCKVLKIDGCDSLNSLSGLDNFQNLQTLHLLNLANLKDISNIPNLKNLQRVIYSKSLPIRKTYMDSVCKRQIHF